MNLSQRYRAIQVRIDAACLKYGRKREDVRLLAVSKTHPVDLVREAAALGLSDFGENRLAELLQKRAEIPTVQWHLIGQLQTNKVKTLEHDIIVHSLDRLSLADALQKQFENSGKRIGCLVQVNCSGEATKSGVSTQAFDALIDAIAGKSAIEVLGLMTIAENSDDEKTVRGSFALLRKLSERVASRRLFSSYQNWLSMGMSGDFEYAIAEGATHLRIGSALFGAR